MKNKKGRYRMTDPNNAKNREYVSYEDEPLKDVDDIEPAPKDLTKKFFHVFLIICVSVVAVLALLNIDRLTPENISHWFQYDLLGKSEGVGYPVRFTGTSIRKENFDLMDCSPIYCSDTSLVVLNSNAGEYQNTQHSFANPVLKAASGYSIVYNADATGFKIFNRDSMVYSSATERKLFDADIAANGTYGLLLYGDDYLSVLDIYKYDNSKKYTYSFADYYVNRVSINQDGMMAALSGVTANNGGIVSAVYILDFRQENYLQKYEVEDSYIYDLQYLSNGSVIAVGSDSVWYFDVAGGEKKEFPYDSKTLTSYSFDKDRGVVLSLAQNPDGRDCDIFAVSQTGENNIHFSTNAKVLSVYYGNGCLAALTPSKVTSYDNEGKSLSEADAPADAKKVCAADKNTFYTMGNSELVKIQL